jgi:hypothetical protein
MMRSIARTIIGKSIPAFLPIWLIQFVAATLLVFAWRRWHKRLSDRLTLAALLAFSALALLGEMGFYLQVHNLDITFDARFDTGVSWGINGSGGSDHRSH